jgi:hypothetical protein
MGDACILSKRRRKNLLAATSAIALTVLVFATNKSSIQLIILLAWVFNVGYLLALWWYSYVSRND